MKRAVLCDNSLLGRPRIICEGVEGLRRVGFDSDFTTRASLLTTYAGPWRSIAGKQGSYRLEERGCAGCF